jgi:hypothetical protein
MPIVNAITNAITIAITIIIAIAQIEAFFLNSLCKLPIDVC